MPQFEIEDTVTGLKILAEGNSEPTQQDAQRLIEQELGFLSTNVFHAPGNRIMLDVGPLSNARRLSDAVSKLETQSQSISRSNEAFRKTMQRTKAGELGFDQIYAEELAKITPLEKESTESTEKILQRLPENTLLIVSHGSEHGGLGSDTGHQFTLDNLAKVIGAQSNSINNVVNVACYGGNQCPIDYQRSFPNATNILHSDTNKVNELSVARLESGDYFMSDSTPTLWQRLGPTNWTNTATNTLPRNTNE